MRKKLWAIIVMLVFSTATCFAAKHKVIFVIIDGVEPHFLLDTHPPTILDIAGNGNFGYAFCGGQVGTPNQTTTISAVGYANILTGTWMNKHNVLANSDINANYNYWNIFRIAKEQKRTVTTAVFTSWTDNITKLVGADGFSNNRLRVDYPYAGYDLDSKRFPHKPDELQLYDIDSTVCVDAARCIEEKGPDVSWLYLWYSDDAGHFTGFSSFTQQYLLAEDRQLAKVWEAVKERERKYGENWMVIVTTDHGRDMMGYDHGGQSETERNIWISTNVKDVNAHFRSPDLSQVDINPTICRWMDFNVDRDVLWEQEGIPFIGPVDIDHLRTYRYGESVVLQWNVYNDRTQVDIYVATTNNFKNGGSDKWTKVACVPASDGRYTVDLSQLSKSSFYKIVVAAPHNHLSAWYVPRQDK